MVVDSKTQLDEIEEVQIDVSTLGSHVFCPRAGVIAFGKQGTNNQVENPRIPNLSYLPIFDERLLRDRFDAVLPSFKRAMVSLAGGFAIFYFVSRTVSPTLGSCLSLALLPALYIVLRDARTLVAILAILSRSKRETPTPLLLDTTNSQRITWWGLHKAGFRSVMPKEPYRDEDLVLAGLPWRLLASNDGQRIPVIKHVGEPLKLNDSHRVRLAAYSHLIMKNEPSSLSNWGIVIDGTTLEGFAFPINETAREKAIFLVSDVRKTLKKRQLSLPIAEPDKRACLNCPYGYPRVYQFGFREWLRGDKKGNFYFHQNGNGNRVHSECGDEFEWKPPHKYWEHT